MRRSPARFTFPPKERARHRGSVSLVCYRWFPERAPSTSRSFSRRRSGLGSLSLCVPIAWSRYFLRSPHAPLSRSSGSPGRWRRGLYRMVKEPFILIREQAIHEFIRQAIRRGKRHCPSGAIRAPKSSPSAEYNKVEQGAGNNCRGTMPYRIHHAAPPIPKRDAMRCHGTRPGLGSSDLDRWLRYLPVLRRKYCSTVSKVLRYSLRSTAVLSG